MNTAETPGIAMDELLNDLQEQRREVGDTRERGRVRGAVLAELRKRHPGQYAAVREVWDGDRLVEPYALAIGSTLADVRRQLRELPADQRDGVCIQVLAPAVR